MGKKNIPSRSRGVAVRIARPTLTALALAAASAVAHAQFFSSTGNASSFPTNVFPINGAQQTYNLVGSSVSIGSSAAGTFSATNGGVLLADALSLGNGGTGSGTVTVSGAGTLIGLGSTATTGFNRLEVGNWGFGSLTVSAGALIDATAACAPGQRCGTFIGNAAGSTGVLNIDGAGSTVSTIGFTSIGQTSVFTTAVNGFDFGTPGGTTNGTVNITNGGLFQTQRASVGSGPSGTAALGTEQGIGNIVIDGAGSRWLATRDTVSNTNASVSFGNGVGGQGTLLVRNGGQLVVDGTGGSTSNFDNLTIGNRGQGTATVTGVGSNITVQGNNPNIGVGANGGQGTLNVLAGATVNSLFFNVGNGPTGTTGTATFDGAGTTVTLSGVGTPGVVNANGAGFLTIGRNGGSGQATVSNGARIVINDAGLDSRGSGSPGLQVARDLGSNGTLTITGAGSEVRISSTSLGVATNDNFNPFVAIGRFDAGTTGTLSITNGGKLILEGNAVSTPTDARGTTLAIGGSSDTVAGGTGTATVSGAGSEIRVSGSDAFISVGRGPGAVGTLSILNQGTVSSGGMNVGRGVGGNGTLVMNNGTLNFSGQFNDGGGSGAFLTIGNRGGTGTATITNGSQVNITNLGSNGAGLSIGGTAPNPTGTGTLTLSGGSQINITAAAGLGFVSIGRDGTGTANITQGSSINVAGGTANVGVLPGGQGSLTISGGSLLTSNLVGIGGSSDTAPGGSGTATVSGAGSELRASGPNGFIGVGRGGTGSLTIDNQGLASAIAMSVGRSGGTGVLTVNNAQIQLAGQQTAGNLSGASFAVGTGGGTGTATLNNSTLSISNAGSAGASMSIGGSPNFPTGTATLNVTNSQINITAATGPATARIGHDGTATATLTNSSLNLSNGTTASGSVIIAGLPGSVATMTLNAGSVINAAYVGVGATPSATPGVQNPGGVGRLVLNDSTVNTTTFEIGALGTLSGNNGVINASGDVIVGGTIDPGNSPGRIRINCNLISLPGSVLRLEIQSDGAGGFITDQLVIGDDSTFDFSNFRVVFSFLDDTDVNAFAASGGFDFDNFLRTGVGTDESQGLSAAFGAGVTWANQINSSLVTVESMAYNVSGLTFGGDGGVTVTASRIPEPATWLMVLMGLAAMSTLAKRRRVAGALVH